MLRGFFMFLIFICKKSIWTKVKCFWFLKSQPPTAKPVEMETFSYRRSCRSTITKLESVGYIARSTRTISVWVSLGLREESKAESCFIWNVYNFHLYLINHVYYWTVFWENLCQFCRISFLKKCTVEKEHYERQWRTYSCECIHYGLSCCTLLGGSSSVRLLVEGWISGWVC